MAVMASGGLSGWTVVNSYQTANIGGFMLKSKNLN